MDNENKQIAHSSSYPRQKPLNFALNLEFARDTIAGLVLAVVLWCWMVLGVLVLAFLNYLVLFMDPLRPADTPEWIAYSELGGLTLAWPLVLILDLNSLPDVHLSLTDAAFPSSSSVSRNDRQVLPRPPRRRIHQISSAYASLGAGRIRKSKKT